MEGALSSGRHHDVMLYTALHRQSTRIDVRDYYLKALFETARVREGGADYLVLCSSHVLVGITKSVTRNTARERTPQAIVSITCV